MMFLFSQVTNEQLLYDVSYCERIDNWDQFFLSIAFLSARRSKDPSTKTGCCVTRDRHILTTGYNGFARGCPDDPELYADREYKYANIVHCDHNAVLQAAYDGISLKGATMYLTAPPCTSCSLGIIQSGIIEVVWPADNKFECDPETGKRWDGDATGDAQALKNLAAAGVAASRWGPVNGRVGASG
jgi:dCMP deaminase